MRSIFLVLILMLMGCNGSPPDGWYVPGNNVSMRSTPVVLKADNPAWTYAMRYDSRYVYTIKVFSAYPVSNPVPGRSLAVASGTASFCNSSGSFNNIDSLYTLYAGNYLAVKFTKEGCRASVGNADIYVPGKVYTGSIPYSNSGSLLRCYDLGCCINPGAYAVFGCDAINGVPFNGGNSGRVGYQIRGNSGNIIKEGIITDTLTTTSSLAIGAIAKGVSAPQSGDLFLRVIDEGIYADNYGQYEVAVEYPYQQTSFISNLAEAAITPITSQVREVSMQFWDIFVSSNTTRSLIVTMMVLYIMMVGIYVVMGSTKFTQRYLVEVVLKFGILTALISPLSYNFFNRYLFQLFVEGQADLINAITTPDSQNIRSGVVNYDSAFAFTNYVVNTLFSMKFFTTLVSFLLWFPIGWFCMILVFLAFIEYTIAIIEAFVLYLVATTAVQLLIAMGPIFISLILFERTRVYFMKWIGAIISFAMQPIILFACIMLVTTLIFGALSNIMGIRIEWNCVQEIHLNLGPNPFNNDVNIKIPLGCIYWFNPVANMFDIIRDSLIFYLLVRLIKDITTIATGIASYLFGGAEMLGAAGGIASSVGKSIRSAMKKEPPKVQKKELKKDDKGGDQKKQSRPGAEGDKGVSVSGGGDKSSGAIGAPPGGDTPRITGK